MDTAAAASLPLDRQLLALNTAALAIASDLSLAETLKRIVAVAAELVDARYAALGVPDDSGEFLIEFVTVGMTAEQEARISHRPRGHGLLGLVMQEGQAIRLRSLAEHPASVGFPAHHPPMSSFLGVPLIFNHKRLGNLYLTDKRSAEEFSERDQFLIELLAAHAAVAIENARLHGQVQQLRIMEERQRIGMDLHDGVIQSIYAVGLNLEYIDGLLTDNDTAAARPRVREAIDALNATIRDIRNYILDLRPRRFRGDDLIAGLRQLLNEFKANTLMTVDLRADPLADRALTAELRLAMFHVAQEALSNAARHSRASRMDVRLLEREADVLLALRDNGSGFDPAQAEQRIGHGLMNMRDRAAAVGGPVEIESPDGRGTEVRMLVPKRPA